MNLRPRTAEGRRLLDAAAALRAPMLVERSIKLVPGTLCADRFLVSLPRGALGDAPLARLRGLLAEAGLAMATDADLAGPLHGAEAIHLGYEGTSAGPVRKLYFEYAGSARAAIAAGGEGALVHLAYKWGPGGMTTSRYRLCRGGARGALAAGIAALCPEGPARVLGLALLARALAAASPDDLMLLAVSEGGGPRLSYDLNLYEAGLTVGAAAGDLAAAAAALGVEAADPFARVAGEPLGHVAGGIGRDGRPFVTLYHGGRAA